MALDWRRREGGEAEPEYESDSEYFSIHWHIVGVDDRAKPKVKHLGYIDFVCMDKISKVEIDTMCRELGVRPEDKKFFFKDPNKNYSHGLKNLDYDADALELALYFHEIRLMHVYVIDKNDELEQDLMVGNQDFGQKQQLQETEMSMVVYDGNNSEGNDSEGNNFEDSDFVDSDYELGNDEVDDELFEMFVDMEVERSRTIQSCSAQLGEVESDESKYTPSEELISCSSNDESDGEVRQNKVVVFSEETEMSNPKLEVGMLFSTFKQFKEAVKSCAIRSRNEIIFRPNTKQKCKAKCKKGCDFFIWAYLRNADKSSVQIKSANFEHTCSRQHLNRHVTSKWIAEQYLDRFRADPTWSIAGIKAALQGDFGVDVSALKAWRARNFACQLINGDELAQLARLHDYKLELLRSNPGSTVVLDLDESIFTGMYVCLGALKESFKFCRPLISIDGCWLKGLCGGKLLSAVGIDANDCIYPVAWAVVPIENKVYWKWFLALLAEDLEINNSYHWTFMSDRQKGLIPAIEELFPNAEHRFCVRHIYNNFRKKFRTLGLKELLWGAARASTVEMFQKIMDRMGNESKPAHNYMNSIAPHHWSRSHFRIGPKCDMLLNNLCECFNSFILDSRAKGVISNPKVADKEKAKIPSTIQKQKKVWRPPGQTF